MGLIRRLGFTSFAFWFGLSAGLAGGAGAMLIAFPFIFPPPVLNEPPPDNATSATRSIFEFDKTAPGRDLVHWANGTGAIIPTGVGHVLRFNEDFEAGPGPNYWIYLNTRSVGDETDFKVDAARQRIAPLRAFKGGQNYPLPSTIDISAFHTVTIWCEPFGVYIGSARLVSNQ